VNAERYPDTLTPEERKRRRSARKNTKRITKDDHLRLADTAPPSLLQGHQLVCPACEGVHDILAYTPLNHSKKYEEQVVVPYVCPSCRHIFALRP
jgi:hypothetical protein